MLPELPPTTFASLVGVDVLPAAEYGILQVLNSTGSAERFVTESERMKTVALDFLYLLLLLRLILFLEDS